MPALPPKTLNPKVRLHRLHAKHPGWNVDAGFGGGAHRAFEYIHANGYLHNDVKPANLMLKGEKVFPCPVTALSPPFLVLSPPFLVLSLPSHRLSLSAHRLSLPSHCPFAAFPCPFAALSLTFHCLSGVRSRLRDRRQVRRGAFEPGGVSAMLWKTVTPPVSGERRMRATHRGSTPTVGPASGRQIKQKIVGRRRRRAGDGTAHGEACDGRGKALPFACVFTAFH